jgi:GTP-binding protein EngB required for normal cell division
VLDYAERAGELRNAAALVEASRIARERSLALDPDSERLVAALDALDPRQRLPLLDSVGGRRAAWAHELRRDSYAAWLRPNLPANWRELLQETAALGEKLGDPGVMTPLTALAVDLERPLRVAVIGEFNAGKSTFVNALLGSAVVPTGVLPTTATVNHLVWGTERAAEIQLRSLEPNRTLAHAELGPALAAYDPACIAQVEIRAPLELLRRLEIIDTPGFNAPEAAHAAAARQAIGDAHVVVWLLDAAQPFKASERAIGSELARLELPLVVLINKLDRLGNDELPLVLDHVTQALQQLGLRLEAPPLPLSARSAVTGRSGDALRLAASNWRAVEQLIERLLAARSVALRERVMRQKLGRTLARLEESARRLAAERTARLAAVHARNRALSELASRVAARRPTLSAAIASVLEQRIAALWPPSLPQLAPMAAGARRLLEGQARAGLSEPMVTAVLAAAGVPPELRAELEPVLNVRFGGLVAALAPALAKTSLGEVALAGFGHTPSIAHASELAVDELLLSLKAMQAPIPDGAPTRTPTEQRLEALQAALAAAMA